MTKEERAALEFQERCRAAARGRITVVGIALAMLASVLTRSL